MKNVKLTEQFFGWVFGNYGNAFDGDVKPRIATTSHFQHWGTNAWIWQTQTHALDDLESAAFHSTSGFAGYFRQSTVFHIPEGKRGEEHLSIACGHFWLDVDFLDETSGHKAKNLATSAAHAARIVDSVLPPSAIVHSGGGVYPIWRLTQPVTFDNLDALESFKRVGRSIRQAVMACGIHVDDTQSLDRILRPVGSVNQKGGKRRPVTWLIPPQRGAGDYNLQQIVDAVPPIAPPRQRQRAFDPFLDDRHPIAQRFNTDERNTWEWILAQDKNHKWVENPTRGGVRSWRRRQQLRDGNPDTLRIDKDDPTAVIVCSSVVAAEWDVLPGRRLDKFGLACRIVGKDPSLVCRGLE